jgi:hypothetical protein
MLNQPLTDAEREALRAYMIDLDAACAGLLADDDDEPSEADEEPA